MYKIQLCVLLLIYFYTKAQEAQLVEQKIEDFWVVSSSLTLGNNIKTI